MAPSIVGPALLWTLLWASVGVLALQLVLVVGARVARTTRQGRDARALSPLRPLLLELASGDDDASEDLAGVLAGAPPSTRMVLDEAILQLLGKIRGDSSAALVDVLHRHGRERKAIEDLASRSSVTRAHAVWTLGVMQEAESVPKVVPLLHDRSPDVALTAARALGMMGDPVAATAILTSAAPVGSRPGLPAWIAVEAVTSLGTVTAPQVRAALDHPSSDVRWAAAMVIAQVPLLACAQALRESVARETHPRLVSVMVLALGVVGSPRDTALLGSLLEETQDAQIRRAAIGALAEVGGSGALVWLQPMLSSSDVRVAERAATTLVSLSPAGHAAVAAIAQSEDSGASARLCRYAVRQHGLGRSRAVRRAG
ncbi:MAG: HEAT repeat domain-containing protein [Ornithinimicrobium sp.]